MEYLVTAHPPTTVSHSVRGRFTSSAHDSLAIVRPSSIALFDLLPSGPVEVCKPVELWGRVIGAEVWSPPPSGTAAAHTTSSDIGVDIEAGQQKLAYLLVLLDAPLKPLLLVCCWSADSGTLAVGERIELSRPVGARENEFWQGLVVDRPSGTVAAGIWCGSLSVVVLAEPAAEAAVTEGKARPRRGKAAVQQGLVKSKFDVQLRDLNLLALVFAPSSIDGPSNPSLAFLTLTPTRDPHLRVRELDLAAKDLAPLSEETDRLALHVPDESAGLLVPIPSGEEGGSGAILVVGEKALTVYDLGPRQPSTRGTPGKGKSRADSGSGGAGPGLASSGSGKRRRSSAASSTASSSFIRRDGASKVPRLDEEDDEPQASGSNSFGRAVAVVGKIAFSEVTAWEVVDSDRSGARVLLGDSYGQLKLALLKRGRSGRIESVDVIVLGMTSPAKCLTYLTSSHVFVGSHFANSVVVSILPSPIPYVGTYLAPPSASFDNLAPILDFCVSAEGEGEVVTCSGGNGAGSLRVVRNGAGWEQVLAIEGVSGVERIWSMRSPTSSSVAAGEVLLVASTSSATHLLLLSSTDDGMAEAPSAPMVSVFPASANSGLDQRPSIHVGSLGPAIVQVTKEGVLLVDASTGNRSEWKPEGAREEIGVAASSSDGLVLLGLSGGCLVLLRASIEGLVVVGTRQLPCEISAVTISAAKAAVALWDLSLLTFDLARNALDTVLTLPPTPTLARSLLFAANPKAEQQLGLFAGLGDGNVVVSLLSADGSVLEGSDVRKLNLGSTEVQLMLSVGGSVLASCDRPAVLQLEARGRVGYQYVSVKDVTSACSVDLGGASPLLLLVTPDSLILGRLDNTKKTQIQTIPFGADSPYRIAFHPELRSYGVAFIKSEIDRFREEEVLSSSFKLLDDDFRPVFSHELEAGERATALELVHLRSKVGGESLPVFLLGTAMLQPDQSEVQRGRILLLNVGSDGKLHMSRAIDVAGMVYAFAQLAQDGFAATVNSRVILFSLDPAFDSVGPNPRILRRSQWASAYLPASLAQVGESQLLVGDAMSSLALIESNLDSDLLTVAKDLKPLWLTSVGTISDTNFVSADVGCNLSTFKLADGQLETGGAIHLGDIVNQFRKGSLRPQQQQQQQDSHASANLVFAASSGRVSVLANLLGPETSHTLFDLQRNMAPLVRGFGGVEHADWRAYRSDVGSRPSAGFIDGDFIETFLDIKDEDVILEIMEGASKWEKIEMAYGDLCSLLEGLRRLH